MRFPLENGSYHSLSCSSHPELLNFSLHAVMDKPNTGNAILDSRIVRLTDALSTDYKRFNPEGSISFYYTKGMKYLKLFTDVRGSKSIHAFIDFHTGDLYKPASSIKPASHVRYNLLDNESFQNCLLRADWSGGYLYLTL